MGPISVPNRVARSVLRVARRLRRRAVPGLASLLLAVSTPADAVSIADQLTTLARTMPGGIVTLERAATQLPSGATDRERLDAWRGLYIAGLWSDAGLAPLPASDQTARTLLPNAKALARQLGDEGTLSVLLAYEATLDYWPSMRPFTKNAELDEALRIARASGDADALCLVLVRRAESGYAGFRVDEWTPYALEASRLQAASPVCRAYALGANLSMNGYYNSNAVLMAQRGLKASEDALSLTAGKSLQALDDRLRLTAAYMVANLMLPGSGSGVAPTPPDVAPIIESARRRGDDVALMSGLIFLAAAHAQAGQHASALSLAREATAGTLKLSRFGRSVAAQWAIVIAAAQPQTSAKELVRWRDQVLSIPEDVAPRHQMERLQFAQLASAALGDMTAAYGYLSDHRKVSDQINLAEQSRAIDEMNVRYETQRRELENQTLRLNEVELIGRRNALVAGLAASLVGLAVVGWLLTMQWRQRRRIAVLYGRLEATNRTRSEQLAAACHDLRQPAFALAMLSELAVRQPQEAASRAEDLRRNSLVLSDMLSELLDQARLESGTYHVAIDSVALGPLLDEVRAQYAGLCLRKRLVLRVAASSAWVRSDGQLLRRIVFNLVSNAVKYTDRGEVSVAVETDAAGVRLIVKDTGRGIPANRIAEMLQPYTRLDHGTDDGLGIGLSVVQRGTQALGHDLDIASDTGRGTTVTLRLGQPQAAAATMPAALEAALPNTLVAVLDDNEELRDAMGLLLRDWGLEVLSAASGDALERQLDSGQRTIGALVTDYSLGGDDGLQVAKRLRQRPGLAHLPVLLLTGSVSLSVEKEAVDAGYAVMIKPARPARLRKVLGMMLLPDDIAVAEASATLVA